MAAPARKRLDGVAGDEGGSRDRTSAAGSLRLPEVEEDLERLEIELLLEAIYRRYGFDFREYAPASLKRRLWRRIRLEGLASVSGLQERLLHDPTVMERLLLDLSVNVTAMFRDPSFHVAFRRKV